MTTVSVIIPTRDRPDGLQKALTSGYGQSWQADEIIVVDDGSEPAVKYQDIEKPAAKIKVDLIRNEIPKGAANARNQGASIAKGTILMFLDDDDIWEENKIRDQIMIFDKCPDAGLVYSGRMIVSGQDTGKPLYKVKARYSGYLYPKILYQNLIGTTSSVAIKKKLFEEIGGFDESLPSMQDHDLYIRATRKAKVLSDEHYNVRYVVGSGKTSQISSNPSDHLISMAIIWGKYEEDIKSQGLINARRIRAGLYFYAAKAAKSKGYLAALPLIMRSLFIYPRPEILSLLLPQWLYENIKKARS